MKKVIVIGAGPHAAEIDDYIHYAAGKDAGFDMELLGFLNNNPQCVSNYHFRAPVLDAVDIHIVNMDYYYIMGIANLTYRRPVIERFITAGAHFLTFIHPDAYISESAVIGEGVVIAPGVNVGPNVKIGDFTLINSRSSIGHDSQIGRYNFICPNVCFSGFTFVGDENLFGINSCTTPGITIGNKNTIAAGMVLDKPVTDNETVFYRYKEKIMLPHPDPND
jgi:sugar O-acyltransferase (sialic acid O-acetyltransferase NeuD family)